MSLLTLRTGRRTSVSPFRLLADGLAGLGHGWTLWTARRSMSRLDDAVLHDIGVPRADIDAAVRHGRAALRR